MHGPSQAIHRSICTVTTDVVHDMPTLVPPSSLPSLSPEPLSDEMAQEIIDQALESSRLKQRDVVAVITGITGSGKTWLLSRLFRRPPPELYSSTGITEQSCRGLLHHVGKLSSGSWQLLSHKEILELLAPLFLTGMSMANVASLPVDSAATEDKPPPLPPPPSSATTPQSLSPSRPKLLKSPTGQAMVRLVKTEDGSQGAFELELVHMIDTGGQPEFMETMPCLLQNSDLAVLVLNLEYGLEEHPRLQFHVKGIAYKTVVPPQHTNWQIIQKLASTMARKASRKSGQCFRILVVATHRDCEG